jgi:surface antigen
LFACGDRQAGRHPQYNGTWPPSLRWPLHRLAVLAVLLGAVAAGCSYPLDSIFEKSEADVEQTGSTAPGNHVSRVGDAATPPEADLAYARAVAADALARGAKDSSIPWENPQTGASGNITPLAASRNEGDFTCRDFLASYVRGQSLAWLQGEACGRKYGKWEVKSLKPFGRG